LLAAHNRLLMSRSAGSTVTVKVQFAVLPRASVAVHVTVLVPMGNVEPDGGVQLAVAAAVVGHSSAAGSWPRAKAGGGPRSVADWTDK